MDWFDRITGFREIGYEDTRSKLAVQGQYLHSLVNHQRYAIGELKLISLRDMRELARQSTGDSGRLDVECVSGDIRKLHQQKQYAGALFQVASQFNMLEMVGPNVTPEHGVTRYEGDGTQGPACAIAAGAATIYRNYFAPVGGAIGQTRERQLDGLASLGQVLSKAIGKPVESLWNMKNGYALCTESGLRDIEKYLTSLDEEASESLRGELCVGLHNDVEVTDAQGPDRPLVSQIFCSALPVAYCSDVKKKYWQAFASLVLQAAYEATMWAAVLNARRGASNVVLLTHLGGGAFGNDHTWIDSARRSALKMVKEYDLSVKLVSRGKQSTENLELAKEFTDKRSF